jgi:hypothetical protein
MASPSDMTLSSSRRAEAPQQYHHQRVAEVGSSSAALHNSSAEGHGTRGRGNFPGIDYRTEWKKLRIKMGSWAGDFERENGRPPSTKDDSDFDEKYIAWRDLYYAYKELEKGQNAPAADQGREASLVRAGIAVKSREDPHSLSLTPVEVISPGTDGETIAAATGDGGSRITYTPVKVISKEPAKEERNVEYFWRKLAFRREYSDALGVSLNLTGKVCANKITTREDHHAPHSPPTPNFPVSC